MDFKKRFLKLPLLFWSPNDKDTVNFPFTLVIFSMSPCFYVYTTKKNQHKKTKLGRLFLKK